MLLLLALACHDPALTASTASAWRPDPVDELTATLDELSLPADTLLREAGVLGEESGWAVLSIPAFPRPGEPFRLLAMASLPREAPVGATLHATTDAWVHAVDLPGQEMRSSTGRPFYLWGPAVLPNPTQVDLAIKISEPALDVWLNDLGTNYQLPVQPPVRLSWIGDPFTAQDGLTRLLPADPLFTGHDLTVYASTFPEGADVAVRVRWWINGAPQPDVKAAITGLHHGAFANDTRWEAVLPSAALGASDLVTWEVIASSTGPDLVLDDAGSPFHGVYNPAPTVQWWDTGVWGFSSCHWTGLGCYTGWQWDTALPSPLDATPGQFQAGAWAPIPGVEVFVSGVTDRTDYDPAEADLLRVEVLSPFFSGSPGGPWTPHPIPFSERSGNNLRYAWNIRDRYHPTMEPVGVSCPEGGTYPYRFRVSVDGGTSWTTMGPTDFPLGTVDGSFLWQNFLITPDVTTIPSDWRPAIPTTPVGAPSITTLTLVNTQNVPIRYFDWEWDLGNGEFEAGFAGCPDIEACEFTLQPGQQKVLSFAFDPLIAGGRSDLLRATRHTSAGCAEPAPVEVELFGMASP